MGVVRKLIVEIVDARSLLPKDGHGTSSPYVIVDFYGQRKKTRTVIRDLNPVWNEVLEFKVGAPSDVFGDTLELDVYHDRAIGPTRRNNFLGRIRLNSGQFVKKGEEALIYFPLEKKSLFSWIQGEIGLKVYYVDEPIRPPSPPPPPPPEKEEKPETVPVPEPEPPKTEETPKPPEPNGKIKEDATEAEKSDTPAEPAAETPPNAEKQDEEVASSPQETTPASDPINPSQETTVKPADSDLPPPEASAAPVVTSAPPTPKPPPSPPRPKPVKIDQMDFDPTHEWIPPPPAMASMMSRTTSDIKMAGFNAPRPISRQTTTDSFFVGDYSRNTPIERSTYDLVEKMHYLFVKIVKARQLPTNNSPVVKISISNCHVSSKPARKVSFFEWDQTFAFCRDTPESLSTMEISVWDQQVFLGGICFDATEIPIRDPPDSPLAPQWYRLEGGGAHHGDLMLATWVGTQADEAYSDSWKSDTVATASSRAKVYLSPKLWYLRVSILEAQDVLPSTALRETSFQIKAQLGLQVLKTKPAVSRNGSPSFNEDLIFVAAEPFSDHLVFSLEARLSKGIGVLGVTGIPLASIERRVDDRRVVSRWFGLEDSSEEKRNYRGRVHLRLCYDGGYHVMDESAHVCSDFRPTARQLWKPPVGTVELGIVGCKNLIPMKTINGKGTTDAYSVAKYGQKWVRTRTVSDSLEPKWNEQYTWRVYDPCTVLTLGVFDSWGVQDQISLKEPARQDYRMGKVRIRISTLQTGKVYRNMYALLLLTPNGLKKMGDVEIAVRFVRAVPTLDIFQLYTQPMLPLMHHIKPLGVVQQDLLRNVASKIVAQHLSRSEPPLPREVVLYMLDADTHVFSMRKVRANWHRIINVVAGVVDVVKWVEDTRSWKNPTGTLLVHALLVMLVWFPGMIVPTLAFYLFVIGVWNYRFRSKGSLPHLDAKISQADIVDRDELDEEFDTVPSSRSPDTVRMRYDKLRTLGARVQTVLGDIATQGERMQALVTWRDPRATGVFVGLCFIVALVLYLVPSKMVAMALGFYYFRHPLFRDRMPSPALNFFRRLPSLTAQMM